MIWKVIWKDGVTQEEPDITFLSNENGGTYVARFTDGSVQHVAVEYVPFLSHIPSAHELKKLTRQKRVSKGAQTMPVRAKFKVIRIERSLWRKGVEVQTIVLLPVTSGSDENAQFYEATPSGEIKLGTVNAEAAAQFELEGEYYIDFTKAE